MSSINPESDPAETDAPRRALKLPIGGPALGMTRAPRFAVPVVVPWAACLGGILLCGVALDYWYPWEATAPWWEGNWFMVAIVPWTAFLLTRGGIATGWAFRYGAAAATLLIVRSLLQAAISDVEPRTLGHLLSSAAIAIPVYGLLALLAEQLRVNASSPWPTAGMHPQESSYEDRQPGVQHLFALLLCVGAYSAVHGAAHPGPISTDLPPWIVTMVEWSTSVASGMAIASLPLFVARRGRGLKFPRFPGEYYWLAQGLSAAANMGIEDETLLSVSRALTASVFLLASWVTKPLRWRVFFLLETALTLVFWLVSTWGGGNASFGLLGLLLVIGPTALLSVAIWDLMEGANYPWTHWLGVLTILCWAAALIPAIIAVMCAAFGTAH